MNEMDLKFQVNKNTGQEAKVDIIVENPPKDNLLYKFIAGYNGTWDTIRDFAPETSIAWEPKEEGKYTIMVQAKEIESPKPFNYLAKVEYLVGDYKETLIKGAYIDKDKLTVGEKVNLIVDVNSLQVVYRYLIKENNQWSMIKNYSSENTLSITANRPGQYELLVECKSIESTNNCDEFKVVKFQVQEPKKTEITGIRSLNPPLISNEEMIFEIDSSVEDNRLILYKFLKVDDEGRIKCLQDYSSKKILSYIENRPGKYKLLCYAKDMYSSNEFDDRALLVYEVKPYKNIKIENFISDVSSPQIINRDITFKAVVSGGHRLRYRFLIEGSESFDSGYTCEDYYTWKPKVSGIYKVSLLVKDISSELEYEDICIMDFCIEEGSSLPIVIKDVICDKGTNVLIGETINMRIIADGGLELKYRYIVNRGNNEIERIEYGDLEWVNFTPEVCGSYEIEIQVKDKYSLREYDCHYFVRIKVMNFMPAKIEYVLLPPKEKYILGDILKVNVITQNTKETLLRYVTKIEGHLVEETEFIKEHQLIVAPKCSGRYTVEVFVKNIKSTNEYDDKKVVKLDIHDAYPITNTKIKAINVKHLVNNVEDFSADCEGGKSVIYEFYLYEQEQWTLVQNYSRKSYYSFMPFRSGSYKLLVLTKSQHRNIGYEDYDILEFEVE